MYTIRIKTLPSEFSSEYLSIDPEACMPATFILCSSIIEFIITAIIVKIAMLRLIMFSPLQRGSTHSARFHQKFVRLDLFRYRFTIQFGSLKQIGRYKF